MLPGASSLGAYTWLKSTSVPGASSASFERRLRDVSVFRSVDAQQHAIQPRELLTHADVEAPARDSVGALCRHEDDPNLALGGTANGVESGDERLRRGRRASVLRVIDGVRFGRALQCLSGSFDDRREAVFDRVLEPVADHVLELALERALNRRLQLLARSCR